LREATTVEKTSLIATALLSAATDLGETEEGRVCLVLEEAHSLTPEPTEGLTREDQRAVHQTARAVLQGRKYGYGCLLISQRTANVTKTILNQCHTVFALRSYDATGISFLSNYLGDAYSRLLSGLPQFHCAAFGGGISCSAPVIMRLNDPQQFDEEFWQPELARMTTDRSHA
jgi:DNA helicase HerA-like ATPase